MKPKKEFKEFNPLNHILVPKHEILSDDELIKVLDKYSIEKEQLPKIKVSDPAAAKINAKVGDVIRITRNSPSAGKAMYYRLVIEGI